MLPGLETLRDVDIDTRHKRVEPPIPVRCPAAWDSLGRALAKTHVVSFTVSVRDTTYLDNGILYALRDGLAAVAPYVAQVGDIERHVGSGYPVRFAVEVQVDDSLETIARARAAVQQAFVDSPPLSITGPDKRAVDQMMIDIVHVSLVYQGESSADRGN
jgi:hypothetical protein